MEERKQCGIINGGRKTIRKYQWKKENNTESMEEGKQYEVSMEERKQCLSILVVFIALSISVSDGLS
jgi:hypothetical protein